MDYADTIDGPNYVICCQVTFSVVYSLLKGLSHEN